MSILDLSSSVLRMENGALAPRCLPLAGDTHHTTRVAGSHPIGTGVAVSQVGFPDPSVPELRPGVAILARGDGNHFQDALVASPLIHHPRNGPILLTLPDDLDPLVRDELLRLRPPGVVPQGHDAGPHAEEPAGTQGHAMQEGHNSGDSSGFETQAAIGKADPARPSPIQVFLVGALSGAVERQVRRLGFVTMRLRGRDVFETAAWPNSWVWEERSSSCPVRSSRKVCRWPPGRPIWATRFS